MKEKFQLPQRVERYLAALSKLYGQDGKRPLQELIVNAKMRVHEAWSKDNWNGGTYGHALYLTVPETLLMPLIKQKDELQGQIKEDINKINHLRNEFVEEVFLEMEIAEDQDWRATSGLLLGRRSIPPESARRLWNEGHFRVFLSHKAEVKVETAKLKDELKLYGISSFVAHQDIHPTKQWQDEIENALVSMDAFVALMTKNFHDSNWTDQEVGFAFARGVPILSVRLGTDPYGFIGKFQALSCSWNNAATEIAKVLIKQERMLSTYLKQLPNCRQFADGNALAALLPGIERITRDQAAELVAAYTENPELIGSFGFNGAKPQEYGQGLENHLKRLGFSCRNTSAGKLKLV